MLNVPVFKPFFHVEGVPNEGSFLLSEHGHFVLTGHLNDLVVPLIDGRRSADEIADALSERAKMEEVFFALAYLEKQGHLVEANPEMPEEQAAFWAGLGLDGREVATRLGGSEIQITDLCGAGAATRKALKGIGLRCAENGGLHIVLVEDYLQPELKDINARHLANGQPWMLVKPKGFVIWIGPIFVPHATGCWECLAQRLRGNREVESFIERRGGHGPFPVSKSKISASFECAMQAVAMQAAIFIASAGTISPIKGMVVTSNLSRFTNDTHVLVQRPQCLACGDREASNHSDSLIPFSDGGPASLADGGLRSIPPEETYERFRHHVSPITGVVSSLTPSQNVEGSPLRVWVAGHNFALKNDSLYFLQDGLRTKSAGKGMTDLQARTSAMCEAIERYSGVYRGEEKSLRATYRDLGERAIHPNACMLFSKRQYQERMQWLARQSRFQVIPLPFREDVEVEWTPVYSLTSGVSKYVPTGYAYYGYPLKDEEFFYWADSNGNAAGNTIEEAILQGFLELIERDAVCIWWYNRIRRAAVDLSLLTDSYAGSLNDFYRRHGREFWVLDLTSDAGIPVFASISRRVDHPVEDIVMGFGAHLDAKIAIMRAITEMNQFMPAVLKHKPNGETEYGYDDRDALLWWRTATLSNQPYLRPLGHPYIADVRRHPRLTSGNPGEDVRTCVSIAARLGIETLVLNQTRADVGLSVVKVIAPGLRHFWARFAAGRLYDVPVKMGWLSQVTPEACLNPIPMFI